MPACSDQRRRASRTAGGRPALKGKRRPKLGTLATDPATAWTPVVLTEWYCGQACGLEYILDTTAWYCSGSPPAPIRWVLVRDPFGQRDAQAFLCADPNLEPVAILARFVRRWRIETTFQEVREHLGLETHRQWSDLAILRTTPVLLGLYSLVTVWAHGLAQESTAAAPPHPAAWYDKRSPTFSDAIAAVPPRAMNAAGFFHVPDTNGQRGHSGRFAQSTPGHPLSCRLKMRNVELRSR